MSWFLLALIPSALWAITNHIDKYLLSKYLKQLGFGSLILFSSIIGTILLPIVWLIDPHVFQIQPLHAFIIIISGIIYSIAWIPYIYALNQTEASRIAPFFATIPIFTYILGYFFLKEVLSPVQILAAILIIGSAVSLSMEKSENKVKIKKGVIALMMLSAALMATNSFLFKFIAIQESFWLTTFWEYIGLTIFAILILIFVPKYRHDFTSCLKYNPVWILSINGINEILNIGAKMILAYATLSIPLTVAWLAGNTSSFFVFIFGIIITVFFPKFNQENITKKIILHKSIAIIVLFIGSYLLNK